MKLLNLHSTKHPASFLFPHLFSFSSFLPYITCSFSFSKFLLISLFISLATAACYIIKHYASFFAKWEHIPSRTSGFIPHTSPASSTNASLYFTRLTYYHNQSYSTLFSPYLPLSYLTSYLSFLTVSLMILLHLCLYCWKNIHSAMHDMMKRQSSTQVPCYFGL